MTEDRQHVYGIRHEVAQYFELQASRILASASEAASLTTHNQLRGTATEDALRSLLKELLPGRYGVGTGHVVAYNAASAQVDVVVFDAIECFKIPISEGGAVYSVEGTYATVEVKASPSRTSSSSDNMEAAIFNVRSVKELECLTFSKLSHIPTFVRPSDIRAVASGLFSFKRSPVGAIVFVGTRDTFEAIQSQFLEEVKALSSLTVAPDLLCVIDQEHFGLCGFDFQVQDDPEIKGKRIRKIFWVEKCASPGEALTKFLYWLTHKMVLDHFAEIPIVDDNQITGVWPSAWAPVIPRIKVDVSEDKHQWSFPWNADTRKFFESLP